MADIYFNNVSFQLRSKRTDVLEYNSAPGSLYSCSLITEAYTSPNAIQTNERVFLNPTSFRVNKITSKSLTCLLRENLTAPFQPGLFLTSDFTIEMKIHLLALDQTTTTLLDCWATTNGWWLFVTSAGEVQFKEKALTVTLKGGVLAINTDYHIEVTRKSGTLRLFINGALISTSVVNTNHTWATTPYRFNIGGRRNVQVETENANMYFDDIRITNGVARHDAAFIVPGEEDWTTPFLDNDRAAYVIDYETAENQYLDNEIKNPNKHAIIEDKKSYYCSADINHYGFGAIKTKTSIDGVNQKLKTFLLDRDSKQVIRYMQSNDLGDAVFSDLDTGRDYTLIAEDYGVGVGRKNAVIKDYVKCLPSINIISPGSLLNTDVLSKEFIVNVENLRTEVTFGFEQNPNLMFLPSSFTLSPLIKEARFKVVCFEEGNYQVTLTNNANLLNPESINITCTDSVLNKIEKFNYDNQDPTLGNYYTNLTNTILNDQNNPKSSGIVRLYRKDNGEKLGETSLSNGIIDSIVVNHDFNGVEGQNTFHDKSQKTWTNINTPIITKQNPPFSGSSLSCNNTSWIESPTSDDYNFGLGDFYIGCLIRPNALPVTVYDSPIGNWVSNDGICLYIMPDGTLRCNFNTFNINSIRPVIAPLVWSFIEFYRINGIGYLRHNNQIVGTLDISGVPITKTNAFRIGANGVGTNEAFNGQIARVIVKKGSGSPEPFPSFNKSYPGLSVGKYRIDTKYQNDVFIEII